MKQLKKTLRVLPWLALGLALAPSVMADTASKKELVQKVLVLQQPAIDAFARVVVEQPAVQMMQAAAPALQQQPADKREAIGKAIEEDARKFVDDVSPGVRKRAADLAPSTIGTLLEERMTEDELKTLIAWFESPVSRKFGQLQPEMQQALGTKLAEQSRPTVEPKLRALQQSIAGRLGISPQPANKK